MLDMSCELTFNKSSYSSARQENCVEVSGAPAGAAVRDTQYRHLGYLEVPAGEWAALLSMTRK